MRETPEAATFCPACGASLDISGALTQSNAAVPPMGDLPTFQFNPKVNAPANAKLAPGTMLGERYCIANLLGRGGMGDVYKAKDIQLGRQVAIKVLPAHMASHDSARQRLRREAAAAAALDHPFICKVFEIGEEDDVLFLVMEFIDGETLRQVLRSRSLPMPEALRLAGEVAEALEAAHRNRFLHRDLKPANVMVAQGRVKVMDFGLAKHIEAADTAGDSTGAAALTEVGVAVGTLDYMSPEQLKGEPLDLRSDLFSFGVLLCELLGTPHPFRRASSTETMVAILRDPPNLAGDLPPGLMLMIRQLLSKSRDERYPAMADVRADLDRVTANALAPEPRKELARRIPLIGREAEYKELLRNLEEALAGRGSLVMVGGEPGIGKTHLITAILEEAHHRGAYANIGHCYEMEGAPPYVPFVEMLEQAARVAPKESFRLVLGDGAAEVAKLMPELRQMYPDIPPPIQLPPEQQRRFLFNAYREFIERAAKVTPMIAVFEDLHCADEPTLLLLQHLAPSLSTTPMLLIGTYRDTELETTRPFARTLETLLRQKQATRISLRRLNVAGVERMLAALGGNEPPPSLARVIFAETEGNPFFVEEVFRHLSEEGKLFDDAGEWRPGLRVDQLQVPEGVRLVLGRRLDRVGAEARRILTTAAVIGRSFSLRLLEDLENQQQADAVLDAIEEAERAHLVNAEPAGRDTKYRFVHELVRQTLAETLSLPRRQRLHARVAEAIERVYAANLDSQVSALAHHLYQAGATADPEKTTKYLLLAAKAARAGAAPEEALAHLEHAMSLWEGEPDLRMAELTAQRAAVLQSMGRRDEALKEYRKAIVLFDNAGATAKAVETSILLAMDHGWHLEFAVANRIIDQALERLGPAEPLLQMSLLILRAVAMTATGDPAGAARLFAAVKEQCAAVGMPVHSFLDLPEMYYLHNCMKIEEMGTVARRVIETQGQAGDLWNVAEAEGFLLWETCCGRIAETAANLPRVALLAERVGHPSAILAAKLHSGVLSISSGDLTSAERYFEAALKYGEAQQLPWRFACTISLGTLAFLRGNFAKAELWYGQRLEIEAGTHLAGWREACEFAFWAESGGEAGKARAWKAWTDRSWKLPLPGQPNCGGTWLALERSVTGLAWLGKTEEVAALRPITEEMAEIGVWASYDLLPLRTACGIAAACAGDWSAAERHHLTAIHHADTAPYRVGQPMAREWYAKMLLDRNAPADAGKARGLLREVRTMYESLGMPFHASRNK